MTMMASLAFLISEAMKEVLGQRPMDLSPTWTAELGGDNNLFGRDDVIADGAGDRALGVSRENNDDTGELDFEIESLTRQ